MILSLPLTKCQQNEKQVIINVLLTGIKTKSMFGLF